MTVGYELANIIGGCDEARDWYGLDADAVPCEGVDHDLRTLELVRGGWRSYFTVCRSVGEAVDVVNGGESVDVVNGGGVA